MQLAFEEPGDPQSTPAGRWDHLFPSCSVGAAEGRGTQTAYPVGEGAVMADLSAAPRVQGNKAMQGDVPSPGCFVGHLITSFI